MIDEQTVALATPLDRFSALHAHTKHAHPDVLDLSYPNPRTDRDTRAFDLLQSVAADVTQQDLQYTPFGGATVARRKVASALSRRLGLRLGFRDIVFTPGATAALAVVFSSLFQPGDEIVVVTPCWMDYPLYLHKAGLAMVRAPADADKRLDLDALARALGPRTAGVLLSQPACPTGVVHSDGELRELTSLLVGHGERHDRRPLLISDEVHRDQVWGVSAATYPMQLYPDTISIYSFGKAWSLQGQRTGYVALGPDVHDRDRMTERVELALRADGFGAPTALMQRLASRIAGLEPRNDTLFRDQARIRSALADLGLSAIPAAATAFVYVRCPDGLDDWDSVARLADHGLLAMPSSLFHEPGYFRLALNLGGAELDQAAQRIRNALTISQRMTTRERN